MFLAERDNTVTFTIHATVNPMGPIDDILKQIGLQLISKASTGNFSADAEDASNFSIHNLNTCVFIGGCVVQLNPDKYAEAITTNHVSVVIPP